MIIDGFGLAYQSHYAFFNLQTSKGYYSGAFYGFIVSLRALKKKYPFCHITIAWDREPTRRKKIMASYKANRSSNVFLDQISDLKKALLNINVSQSEYEGEEADDVIASLVRAYSTKDNQVFIYSSDKDLLQLVKDGRVIMIRPKRGKNSEIIFDEERVVQEYGITPKNFLKFLVLRGDKSDNIPGTFRVASSILCGLVNKYSTMDEIFNNLDKENLTDYQRKTIESFKEQSLINLDLIKLRDDLNLNILKGKEDMEDFVNYLNKYEIKSLNAKDYIDSFSDIPSHIKKAPAIKNYSLFEE